MICQKNAYPLQRRLCTHESRKELVLPSFSFSYLHRGSGIKLRDMWESYTDVVWVCQKMAKQGEQEECRKAVCYLLKKRSYCCFARWVEEENSEK